MDFLNKALAQVADLFRSMTPGARITTLLLLAAVAVSLGYLFNNRASTQDVYLMNGEFFAPSQIPQMEAAFGKANLNAHLWEGNRLRVPRGQQTAYTAALAEANALPDNYHTIVERMLDKMGPLVDKSQRDLMFKHAIQKQLEMILRGMKGIQNAYVLYDSETKRGFRAETLTTASVSVTPSPGETLDDSKVMAIRSLVAKAIAGLTPNNVAVTDLSTGMVRTSTSENGTGGSGAVDDPHFQRKKAYESELAQKIRSSLSYVPGALVQVNVELDPKLKDHVVTVKHDPKPVTLSTEEESKTRSSDTSTPGGRPGYNAQQPNSAMNLSASSKGNRQEEEESKTKSINTVGGQQQTTENAGLVPRKATASIGVPMSYYVKIWRERNPQSAEKAPDQAALDQIRTEKTGEIRSYVIPLLPQTEPAADPASLVQVTSFQDITPPEIPQPTTTDYATAWLSQNWTTVGMILLAGIAMLMLRSMVRSVSAAGSPAPNVVAARIEGHGQTPQAEQEAPPAEPRLRRFTGKGPSLRDELSQLVQSDPDAAANVLRTWIGSGVPQGKS